eukprot:TRINITY_DN4687_c0_g1_i1.p1 TRINITY_DN4687_c0_g1~~TRINITY_DN4687_c0_g1_i1.p1  ORF type:complete len:237 (-),score=44.00 TRINITY_DN4687_c0_g1_i1:223-933(-)
MGVAVSKLWERCRGKAKRRLLMCGLDAAGKTTVLYKLKLGEVVTTIPTIGFNVETVDYQLTSFTVWDIGGRGNMRALWRHYYPGTDALIFVVDSVDRDRIEDAGDELKRFMNEEELSEVALLVLANKQDLPHAMNSAEVTEKLGLSHLRNRRWFVQSACATTGDGLYEGLDWLSRTLSSKGAGIADAKDPARHAQLERKQPSQANFDEEIGEAHKHRTDVSDSKDLATFKLLNLEA